MSVAYRYYVSPYMRCNSSVLNMRFIWDGDRDCSFWAFTEFSLPHDNDEKHVSAILERMEWDGAFQSNFKWRICKVSFNVLYIAPLVIWGTCNRSPYFHDKISICHHYHLHQTLSVQYSNQCWLTALPMWRHIIIAGDVVYVKIIKVSLLFCEMLFISHSFLILTF